jgi:hypothetical protein
VTWELSARFTSHQLKGTTPTLLKFLEHCVGLVFKRPSQHPCGKVMYEIWLGRNGNHFRAANSLAAIECHETCQSFSFGRGL